METRDLFDFDNDFTEEEEAVFAPNVSNFNPVGTQTGRLSSTEPHKTVVAKAGTGRTMPRMSKVLTEEKEIITKYKAGVTVNQILETYSLSTGRLYAILRDNNIPFRSSSNHVGSTKPALVDKQPISTDREYIFMSDVAARYGLTSGQVRSYCLVLEDQGYQFNRIQRGQRDARIFNDKDINIMDRMIEELRIHSMVEAAVLALYNHDVQPPKVDVKLDGETLVIHIEKNRDWTADEINVVINLKEEN